MISLDELKSTLWGAAQLLRGKINATGYKEYIFPLVFFKRISDVYLEEREKALALSGGDEEFADDRENHAFAIPKGCLWNDVRQVTENVGQALVTAWTRIEQANPSRVVADRVVEGLAGIFGKRDHWTNKNLLTDETLSELIEHFSKADLSIANCPADEMGNAYEYLVGKFADDAGNTAQEFYTNRTVVELMAEILEPKAGESIYDPTCGTGGMLISCIARCKAREENWREIKAYGQEQNALTAAVARMNLFLHGVEEFRIVNDDTLLRPAFLNAGALRTFDVVLANPPYSIKQWNRELFAHDPFGRNFLGTPPQGRADYAFIQHILKSMDPKTGRAAILLPHGVLFREEEREIRKALLDSDLLEAVIGLGPNLFYNSPMEACIMICRARKPAASKGRVLFINAVEEVTRKNGESKLEEKHQAKILAAYRERPSDGVFSYDASREEIAAKNDSLAISLYAHVAASRGDAEERSLEEVLGDFAESSSNVLQHLSKLAVAFGCKNLCVSAPLREKNCCDISRRAAEPQRVKFDDIAFNIVAKKKPTPEDAATYIGLEHIDPGTFEISRWGGDVAPIGEKLIMKKGDLLFGKRRAYQRKVAIAPFDGIFSAHGMILRPKKDVVDPSYFPFFIASDQFMDEAVRISVGGLSPTINWKTLKECEFDLPPMERQKELAEVLWAANDLKEKYKKMIAATDEMLKAKFREMFVDGGSHGGTETRRKWPRVEIGTLVTDVRYGTSKPGSDVGEYEYLRMNNMTYDGYFDLSDIKRITVSEDELPKCLVHKGDLLFNRTNTKELVGKTCYYDFDRDMIIAGYIIRIRLKDNVLPQYLWKFLNSDESKQLLHKMAKGAIHQANINAQELQAIKIPLPPLALQKQFVEIAQKADEAKAALKRSISDVEAIIKGLVNG